jgi:hypothetical protein
MGFDVYIRVTAKIPIEDFLVEVKGITKTNIKESLSEVWNPKPAINYFRKLGHEKFFKGMKIIISEEGLEVTAWDNSIFDGLDQSVVDEYCAHIDFAAGLLLCEYYEKTENIENYLKIFCDQDWKITTKVAKQTIFYDSSYKGRDKLNINYRDIADKIDLIEKQYSSAEIITKISMN